MHWSACSPGQSCMRTTCNFTFPASQPHRVQVAEQAFTVARIAVSKEGRRVERLGAYEYFSGTYEAAMEQRKKWWGSVCLRCTRCCRSSVQRSGARLQKRWTGIRAGGSTED